MAKNIKLHTYPTNLHTYITKFIIKQILIGENGPLKLNLLMKKQILMVKTGYFTITC